VTFHPGVSAATPVRVWRCVACERTFVAQGKACVVCGAATEDMTTDGRGTLGSWTIVHAVPPGEDPYLLGWAELDGVGVGVLGRLLVDEGALRSGLRVRVRQTDSGDGWPRLGLEADSA
jgi:uncharacterized OB-fold protein